MTIIDDENSEELPTLGEVKAVYCLMTNGKALGISDITSDALKSMVWTKRIPDNDEDKNEANNLVTIINTMLLDL
eukprot:5430245-Ditylum_brightwellii.AAC.1